MTLRRSIVGGALLVTAAVGCSDASGPDVPDVRVTIEPGTLAVRMTELAEGGTWMSFVMPVVARNTGNVPVVVQTCSSVISRRAPGGVMWSPVWFAVCDLLPGAGEQRVAPGATVAFPLHVDGGLGGAPMQPWGAPGIDGTYRFHVRVRAEGDGRGTRTGALGTNTFTLVPR